jgi:hypothetical protein
LVKSVWCPGGFLYLNGQLFLKIWEIFCYFVEYIMYPFGLYLFSFFKHLAMFHHGSFLKKNNILLRVYYKSVSYATGNKRTMYSLSGNREGAEGQDETRALVDAFPGEGALSGWPTNPADWSSPAGAQGMGISAGISLPSALQIPGPLAAPTRGTRAMPVSGRRSLYCH